jgi:hypothetical protein
MENDRIRADAKTYSFGGQRWEANHDRVEISLGSNWLLTPWVAGSSPGRFYVDINM